MTNAIIQRPDFLIEEEFYQTGVRFIAGVDEAGRGPLAGPVYAAAVVLRPGEEIFGLDDSKKLSDRSRRDLYAEITEKAVDWAVFSVGEKKIDAINILNATYLAMNGAISALKELDFILIDGSGMRGCEIPHRCIVKGDSLSASIAAASILAKVSRDTYMEEMAKIYPQYGFEQHKGYGTKAHTDAILRHGPCKIHRRSFLKKLIERGNP